MTDTTANKLVSIEFLVNTLGPVDSLDLAMKTLAHISNRDDGKIHDNELLFLLRVLMQTQDTMIHKKAPLFYPNKTLHPEDTKQGGSYD